MSHRVHKTVPDAAWRRRRRPSPWVPPAQLSRALTHQTQKPASSAEAARYSAASASWRGQKLPRRLVDHPLGVALARQPLEARVDGRGLDRAAEAVRAPRRSSRTARRAGLAGLPSAPSVSLLRTQSPRSAVCTVIVSGWPRSSALIPSRVCALIAMVAVVGATRCGRTHSGTATWTADVQREGERHGRQGPPQDGAQGDAEDDREDRVGDRHHPAHRERHRRQQRRAGLRGRGSPPRRGGATTRSPPGSGLRRRARPPAW